MDVPLAKRNPPVRGKLGMCSWLLPWSLIETMESDQNKAVGSNFSRLCLLVPLGKIDGGHSSYDATYSMEILSSLVPAR